MIEVGRNTSQFSRIPVHEFLIQLSHSSFFSRSGFHCSDDFLYSSTLNRPAQVRKTLDQSRHAVSLTLKFSGWYIVASAPNPNRTSSPPCASGTWPFRVCSHQLLARFSRSSKILPAFLCASRYYLACSAASSLFRSRSVNSITCWISAATFWFMISGWPHKCRRTRKVPLVPLLSFCRGRRTSSAT